MLNFSLENSVAHLTPELTYILSLWAKNTKTKIRFVKDKDEAISIGLSSACNFQIRDDFQQYSCQLNSNGLITLPSGKIDFITTAFYLITALQEHQTAALDELGRFQFKNSYQSRLGNTKVNIVQQCFDEISKQIGVQAPGDKTKFFLTHDIDTVNGAWLEDGFNAIKNGRIDLFLKFLINIAMGKPDWLNMDKIMALESEYGCKSVFYWIVNKGVINKRERNADYNFRSKKIQDRFNQVAQHGFENGLHKSIANESFREEINKFGIIPIGNRYHYLKFNLPYGYDEIEKANLKLDASLGFAEEIGFRNNYGLPFQPYNFSERRPYSFVEVPLHVMDRTFYQYKKVNIKSAEEDIFDFFERNKTNCVLSILWHNNFFTNYKFKGYLDLYKKILAYIKENGFGTISQQEIIANYSLK